MFGECYSVVGHWASVCEDLHCMKEGTASRWVGAARPCSSGRRLQLLAEPQLALPLPLTVVCSGTQRGRDSPRAAWHLRVPHADPLSPCHPDPDTAAQDPGPGSGRRSAGARGAEPAAHVPDHGGGGCAAGAHVLAHLPPCTVSCRPGLQLPRSSRLTRAPARPPSQPRCSCRLLHTRNNKPDGLGAASAPDRQRALGSGKGCEFNKSVGGLVLLLLLFLLLLHFGFLGLV